MTNVAHWISPHIMESLGWTLVHFLWQGTALAALFWILITTIRHAAIRYVAGVLVLVAMAAAPVATYLVIQNGGATRAVAQNEAVIQGITRVIPPATDAGINGSVSELRSTPVLTTAFPWLIEAWLIGVIALSLRTAGGFLALSRLQRESAKPVSIQLEESCMALQRRLGMCRVIAYCECHHIDVPTVIGWFRPIVLLPLSALTRLSQQQLETVIAHELAHIKRLDAFVNLFQMFAETVLFYHPAVWWVSHRIRIEREHCCDDAAIAACGNALEYARALTLMEGWRSAPALAMAANRGSLTARVKRLLGMERFQDSRALGFAVGLLCLAVALVASTALLDITPKASAAGRVSVTRD